MVVFFNDLMDLLFDLFRVFCVAVELISTIGGVGFVVYAIRLFFVSHKTSGKLNESCRDCESYETCMIIMGNDLPGHACAYFKNKKP